ncbi:hypothetical protein BH683_009260 [Williamsia sp. 1138]|uniref:hypothetical protein n=1 Tax=Williamsia sp. 1138 TaxID=1903117 RepID=UPI000A100E09|nr:hypothetical protein [Williamsia sp. 1138]OZG29365.1 hypothetical protein BH683_009260 [Williamsia sp. 1138]
MLRRATIDTISDRLYQRRDWIEPIAVFLVIRLIGMLALERFTQLRGGSLGSALSAWDGKWMLAIAEHGYGGVPLTQTDAQGMRDSDTPYAFFPGYPLLAGAVDKIPGFSPFGAALTVNVVLGSLAAVGVARIGALCCTQMQNRATPTRWMPARISGWFAEESDGSEPTPPAGRADPRRAGLLLAVLFAAAPMGIVLSMAYTEALFCALAAWALVGVLEHRWLLAGGCALLSGLSRPTAVVLIAVVILAALLNRRDGWRAWTAIVLSPLGYLGYLAVVWHKTGEPLGWFRIQTEGWNTGVDYGKAAWEFVNYALVNSSEIAPVATAWIIVLTIGLALFSFAERVPWPVSVYGALVVVSIVASSGLMMSRPRLLLPAFVLLIPIAIGLAKRSMSTQVIASLVVITFSSWFGAHMLTVYPHAM